ncbi:hypothetical protein DV738_g3927, partial [Chaetothyriales sp. CBS 135597]
MAPEILSAATYPQELMASYEEDRKRAKRKAAQGSKEDDDNDGNGKKQRGRPRLDPRDETAADRRRTQIRLAQRAYRHRKETAIVGLRQKVANLKTTIDEMHSTFTTLHDSLVRAGSVNADSRLLAQLEAASDQFVKLHKIVDEEDEEDETQKPADIPVNEADISATSSYEYVSVRDWLGMEHNSTSTQFNVRVPDTYLPMTHTTAILPSAEAQFTNRIERPLGPPLGSGPYTYSFQESTFARRLHRMTLEQTYQKLANPDFDPAQLKQRLKFTFCLSNRKRMLHRLQDILKRKSNESLENWTVPYIHIGGAGTHYPRRDSEGSAIYPPNLVPPDKAFGAKFGPLPWIEVETPRDGNVEEILEAIGFGGLWFDANDVEQYLRSKGIYLDGQSSFVEVDPSIIHPQLSQSSSSSWSRGSSMSESGSPSSTRTPPGVNNGGMESANDMYMLPHFDTVSMIDSSLMGTNTADELDQTTQEVYNKQIWPWTDASLFPFDSDFLSTTPLDLSPGAGHSTRPRNLTFDVEKFILRLTEGSACLGRAPGYRREMVDNALALSMTNVLMSFLNPTPSLPKFAGPFEVGSTEFEIPSSEIDAAASESSPWPEITTIKFRLFYPTDAKPCKESISWVPGPQKQWIEAFSKFLGTSLGWSSLVNPILSVMRLITIPAVPNAAVLPGKDGSAWPLLIFSHGLAGNCNAYSSLCGWLASCGIIVAAPEHRDGSAPITHIRAPDGSPSTAIRYRKYAHTPTADVFNARNEQLRIRLWELDLVYASLTKMNSGERLSNFALPKQHSASPPSQISLANTMDVRPGRVSWVGHSFGGATITQFVKSVYYHNSQPSLKGTKYEHDKDWKPLYTPSSNREILSQIRPSSPVALLDVWTLPFHAPSTQWLWEKALPCYDHVLQYDDHHEKPTTVSVMSTEFFNWEALRNRTSALLSRRPAEALRYIEEGRAMSRATTPRMIEEAPPSPRISTPPYRGAEQALARALTLTPQTHAIPTIETVYEPLPPPSLCPELASDSDDTYTLLSRTTSETNPRTPASLFSAVGDSATSSHTDLSTSLNQALPTQDDDTPTPPFMTPMIAAIKPPPPPPALSLGLPPRLFYVPYSAHLSHSDFGLLFPRLVRVLMKAVDAELIMRLNVRAVVQAMRNAGLKVENVVDTAGNSKQQQQRKRWARWSAATTTKLANTTKWFNWDSWTTTSSTNNSSTTSIATTATGGNKAKELLHQH